MVFKNAFLIVRQRALQLLILMELLLVVVLILPTVHLYKVHQPEIISASAIMVTVLLSTQTVVAHACLALILEVMMTAFVLLIMCKSEQAIIKNAFLLIRQRALMLLS